MATKTASAAFLLLIAIVLIQVDAFVERSVSSRSPFVGRSPVTGGPSHHIAAVAATANAVELKPEPAGGEEMTPTKSMADSRMKNMGPVDTVKSKDGEPVYQFWVTAKAEGELIKGLYNQVLKDAAKKANFPGFRKGQVPPYAMPQIRYFAISDSVIQTVQAAVEAYGLKSLPGSDGEVTVEEDMEEISKAYKVGDDLQFTGSFKATFKSSEGGALPTVSDAIDAVADVIDVETEPVDTDN